MMIKCPECGRMISDTARTCPSCRGNLAVLKKRQADFQNVAFTIIFVIAGVVVAFIGAVITNLFKMMEWACKKKKTNSSNLLQAVPSPVPEAVKFHIAVDDQDRGELELEAIKKLVAEGKVRRSTLVWRDGMADWQVAEAQTELRWLFQGQPPPVQPWK